MSVQAKPSAFAHTILLGYRDERGHIHKLSLVLKKPDDFLRALSFQTLSA